MDERVATIEGRWSTEQLAMGIRLGRWLGLLARHRFRVHPVYWHRAAAIGAVGLLSSVLGAATWLAYGSRVRAQVLDPPPLFVLGHWRSGTTHLHNLLAHDPNHTVCTTWQAVFPDHALLTGRLGPRLLANALPATRTYDKVSMSWSAAAEDEIALLKLTGRSFYTALMFPDDFESVEPYVDFGEAATDRDRARFLAGLDRFLRTLMVDSGGKRVVVKSCPHTARVRLITARYPRSAFVYIHRHPARLFASMLHMRGVVDWENHLQRPRRSFVDSRWDQTARLGEVVFRRYLEDRALLGPDRLVELAYDDLCGNELARLATVYERLGLPGWPAAEGALRPYVAGLAGYQRNKLPLDPALVAYVYDRWRFVYDAHGYDAEPGAHL
ncbi:MAG: sulfotransferase [Myxococcota bacterium]